MKTILILLLFSVSLTSQSCVGYMKGNLRVVHNAYLNKYAVIQIQHIKLAKNRTDTVVNFILSCGKNHYGVYGKEWQYTEWNIVNCWDRSLFSTACEAKKFLLDYLKYIELDYWK